MALIAIIAFWTLYASDWDMIVKVVITIVSVIVAIWLWFFLAQRRNNISRNAVEIEKKLSKKRA